MRKQLNLRVYTVYATGASLILIALATAAASLGQMGGGRRSDSPNLIRIPAGGNLQSAVNTAKGGDVIELEAGATYAPVVLPAKTSADFITIRTSAIDRLPEGRRVSPEDRVHMARIVTRKEGTPAVTTAKGAHHFRFVGIEFVSEAPGYVYNLVQFGDGDTRSDVPRNLEIDRSFLDAGTKGVVRRGLALNSAETLIRNSCFIGFAFPGEETQGIAGWTGTLGVKILNNYVEGGAENIMFGGSDPASPDLTPRDIEIKGNHLKKPGVWKVRNASMKTIFELKNAKGVRFVDNYLEDNWIGSAMRITVRNQDGQARFSTIEDVLIEGNVIKGSGDGINILGSDDVHPSGMMRNLTVRRNLFLDIDPRRYEGVGYFILISEGEDITIERNTSFNEGNTITFHGRPPRKLTVRDNVLGHGEYGVHGLEDLGVLGTRAFSNNSIFNSRRLRDGDLGLAPGSSAHRDLADFGFADPARGDFTLLPSSRLRAKGTEGSDIGASLDAREIRRRTVF